MRSHNVLGRQTSDERLYLKRKDGGSGIKSMRDVYQETRLRVAFCMAYSNNKWINAARMRETRKEENAIMSEAMTIMKDIGIAILFQEGCIRIEDDIVEGSWKLTWKRLKHALKNGIRDKRISKYRKKEQQRKIYRDQDQECYMWLSQNLNPKKASAIMTMLEQMVETGAWKQTRDFWKMVDAGYAFNTMKQ